VLRHPVDQHVVDDCKECIDQQQEYPEDPDLL
jgi:hypothetical protein